jgi:hypothetical protein
VLSIGSGDTAAAATADDELVEIPDESPPVTRVGDHWVLPTSTISFARMRAMPPRLTHCWAICARS